MAGLSEQVALVTGASRGVGRGVAVGLAHAGVRVFATGRTIAQANLEAGIEAIPCDHTDDAAVTEVFRRIQKSAGKLDILVNVAWGGYERMIEDGKFTFAAPFWQQPTWRWDAMITAGFRAAFVASQHAARMMLPAKRGLIVNISFWAAQKRIANTLCGSPKRPPTN
jgi:NAD(P)-dependent dehydrogenase (short-subunit alcohol dehydrogenase family)